MPEKKQQELYRRVFSSVDGRMVLTDMLINLCFFDEVEDEEKISKEEQSYLRNYASKILRNCGILKSSNAELMVSALMKMPLKN